MFVEVLRQELWVFLCQGTESTKFVTVTTVGLGFVILRLQELSYGVGGSK